MFAMRPTTNAFRAWPSPASSVRSDEHELMVRVSAEFSEMPGMRLTLAQAVRLFSIDRDRCEHLLAELVDRGVLFTDGHAFARAEASRRRG
jgi:hypothetical protein